MSQSNRSGRPRFFESLAHRVDDLTRRIRRCGPASPIGPAPAAAVRFYESFLDRDASHADSLHLLGIARLQMGHPGAAADLIGRAVELVPQAAVFRATLAEAYRAMGLHEAVIACCRAAIRLGLHDPAVLNNLGLALEALARHADAADAFREALALRPGDAASHTNLGTALRALDQKDQALDHFRRALAIDPDFAPALTNLGQLLLDLGQAEEALPYCRRAARLEPGLPEAHNNLGNALHALGLLEQARVLQRGNPASPQMAQACVNLGRTWQEEGEWDEALPWFRRAVDLQPRSLVFLALLAEAAVERELFDEAINCYEGCSRSTPNWRQPTMHWDGCCRNRAVSTNPQTI